MRPAQALFIVSNRPLDQRLVLDAAATKALRPLRAEPLVLPVRPWSGRPWHWPSFARQWHASVKMLRRRLAAARPTAVVATGGFVAGPVVVAARRAGVPVALVNLDAVPGKANRTLARRASALFTVYDVPSWPQARRIGLPLRAEAQGSGEPADARRALQLDPVRPTLFITGGSQGAESINRMMLALADNANFRQTFRGWQVLHQAGGGDLEPVRAAWQKAGIAARVEPLFAEIGQAWRAATVAISRCGAGSVAEVWANAVPTIFLPYPYHKDEHQRRNAQPLVDHDAAVLMHDQVAPAANVAAILPLLLPLAAEPPRRAAMIQRLRLSMPPDGARVVAEWLCTQAGP